MKINVFKMFRIILSVDVRLRVGAFMWLLLISFQSLAQNENVGIGTKTPDKSAVLDVFSLSKGLLIPRMPLAQRLTIESPAVGLLVYQTDFKAGFYYFDGILWKNLSPSADVATNLRTSSTEGVAWNVDGNAGLSSATHFIGTLDTTSLVMKVNNARSGLVDYRYGNTFLGYKAGLQNIGYNSVALGAYALYAAGNGMNNIAIGYQSMASVKSGSDNVAIGSNTLITLQGGLKNVAIGNQAGLRTQGDGNVFIGFKAGNAEIGSNRLYIENSVQTMPLIYGEFDNARVGINTKTPGSTFSIDSKQNGVSGLEFKQLTSKSVAGKPNQKVLSVDENGKVILVRDSVGTVNLVGGSTSLWSVNGSAIQNTNAGDVIVSNLRFKNLKSTSTAGKSNGKVLSLDANGMIVLVKDSIGTSSATSNATNYWSLNSNVLSNNTGSKLLLNGAVQLGSLKSSAVAVAPTGKVLSVDNSGNLILVRDSVGITSSSGQATTWVLKNNDLLSTNSGRIYVKNGLTLDAGTLVTNGTNTNLSGIVLNKLNKTSTAGKAFGKVLSVDESGNIVLVKDSVGITKLPDYPWIAKNNDLLSTNSGRIYVKNGLTLDAGTLVTNGTNTNLSGIVMNKLRLSSNATNSNGKVLSVDESGNIILVKDSVGVISLSSGQSSSWILKNNDLLSTNPGRVYVKNGLTLDAGTLVTNGTNTNLSGIVMNKLNKASTAGNAFGKVLSVDESGNIILVKDSVGITKLPDNPWVLKNNDLLSTNSGRVYVKNGLTLDAGTLVMNGTNTNSSGLVFNKLKASSPAGKPIGKVLTVDESGNVVLVKDSVGTTQQVSDSQWVLNNNDLSNKNSGKVSIKNGLSIEAGNLVTVGSNANLSGIVLSKLKVTSSAANSSGKVLSVDANGNVILVKDSVGISTPILQQTAPVWNYSNGTDIVNANTGKVTINGSLNLESINSNTATSATTDKVLSVDATGKVIFVKVPDIQTTSTWNESGNDISNKNSGKVTINNTLNLAKLTSGAAASTTTNKVLSVDASGNVILANTPTVNLPAATWNFVDGRLHNANNNSKVVIGTGINSYPDGFQLFVKDGIMTEKIRVAVANSDRWADYVFKKDYRLMPLKEVETFIDAHSHLPNVPSAHEMAKNGLDVVETSAKLMEKIEELTLYLIKANKQIEALEAKVNQLEKAQK